MSKGKNQNLANRLNIQLSNNSYIYIPKYIERIKIDVGLSSSAIHACDWLKKDKNLFVIGFEPLIEEVETLQRFLKKKENSNIKRRILIINCALGTNSGYAEMFITSDIGQSSMLKPRFYQVASKRTVLIESLDNVMSLFNLKPFKYIDFIKIDCQGFDLQVLKGGKKTLKKTAIVTCEAESNNYLGTSKHIEKDIENFLNEIGFSYINKISQKSKIFRKLLSPLLRVFGSKLQGYQELIKTKHNRPLIVGSDVRAVDPTFINGRFKKLIDKGKITAHQFN